MKIKHHIGIDLSPETRRELVRLGFVLPLGIVGFEVDEGDERWPKVQQISRRVGAIDLVYTEWTRDEVATAAWLQLGAPGQFGYPLPEDDYLEATYDLSDHCDLCGQGARQRAAFRMRGEPRWGRRGILQLNWVLGEFFVKPEIWKAIFDPIGVRARSVVDDRSGTELTTVVQLDPDTGPALSLLGSQYDDCRRCGRRKYHPHTRGCFPAFTSDPGSRSVVRSAEFFGHGASADRAILISQSVRAELDRLEVRGAKYCPMCDISDVERQR